MNHELPFFKFHVDAWMTGDVTLHPWDVQGLFINICAYYWKRGCRASIENLRKRYVKVTERQWSLLFSSDLIKVNDGSISIAFLDEQRDELLNDHVNRSESGRKGAEKRWGGHNGAITEPKQGNSIKDIDKEIDTDKEYIIPENLKSLYDQVLPLFEERFHPKTKQQIKNWVSTLDKLIRIDKRTQDEILQVVKWAREDQFWKTNFLSLIKLRETNKEGIKYFDVFHCKAIRRNGNNNKPHSSDYES